MIFKISHSTTGGGILDYHMDKVKEDKAKIVYSSFNTNRSSKECVAEFEVLLSQNTRVYKNKYLHISASFAKEDKISKQEKENIIEEWREKMGYGQNAYMLFHHTDKAHDHYHIVTTSVDMQGKKVNDRYSYYQGIRKKTWSARVSSCVSEEEL